MMVLGLGGGLHDRSACVVNDGRITVAVEHERLSRVRHGVDHDLLTACFERGGFRPVRVAQARSGRTPEIGYVLDGHRPGLVAHQVRMLPSLWRFAEVPLSDQLFRSRGMPSHHTAHAASAFLVSPYDEAVTVVMDAFGSPDPRQLDRTESTSVWLGRGTDLRLVRRWYARRVPQRRRHQLPTRTECASLGIFYSDLTIFCGFRVLDAGKTMGLAPWGDGRFTAALRQYFRFADGGTVQLDPAYLGWFADRKRERDGLAEAEHFELTAAVARAGQDCLEEAVLHVVRWALRHTGSHNLCLAGGVALNAVANRRLLLDTPVHSLYVQPAANDAGIGIGAAAWHYFRATGKERSWVMDTATLGRTYDARTVRAALAGSGLVWRQVIDPPAHAARLIAAGAVVAWFQGGSEFGPRALGNRSILGDPRQPGLRDRLNQVKAREPFRPVAPSVLAEHQANWFEFGHDMPFMTICTLARPERRDRIPAAVHVDGSSRIQTVRADRNPTYHRLITEFFRLTGVPMVVNTSFNIRGPIVETPSDAVRTFAASSLDALIIGDYLVHHADRLTAAGLPATGRCGTEATPHGRERP